MLTKPAMMRSRSHTSSDACSSRSKLFLPDHHDAITKDVAAGCAVTIDAFSYQSDDEPLRVVPFFEIQSPLEKKRRLGRYIRNAHSSRATASYSQTPSESRSLRLLQWSCLFPREVCFELDQDCLPGDLILFDPTEPLIYGELDGRQDPILVQAAHLFHVLLEEHRYICMARREADDEDLNAAVDETLGCIIALLRECPCVAQVHYPLPSEFWMDKNECYCFPLVHFCVTNCLEGLSACYHAFPEAIGCTVHGWLPLHFAAKHSTYSVVQFLLERFPNAARRTHTRTHKTPLHIACQRHDPNAKSSIIRRIMQQYPTALQLADRHGWVPVHHLCACKSTDVYLLQMVIEASPTTIRATTRQLELPLHILCRQGSARIDSMHYLLNSVHAHSLQANATDLDQNNILHCIANNSSATADAVIYLLAATAKGRFGREKLLECLNMDGDRPIDIAKRMPTGDEKSNIDQLLST